MESLVFVVIIAIIAFWLGRRTKPFHPDPDALFPGTSNPGVAGPSQSDQKPVAMNVQRAFVLIFLCGWIIAWTAGIFMAAVMFLNSFESGFVTLFLGGWLIAALAGWGAAAQTIFKLATGRPIKSRNGHFL